MEILKLILFVIIALELYVIMSDLGALAEHIINKE